MPIIDDEVFQDNVAALLIRDRNFIRAQSKILAADDFKPLKGDQNGKSRWLLVGFALEHWQKYREPIGKLITTQARKHARLVRMSDDRRKELIRYCTRLLKVKIRNVAAINDHIAEFKQETTLAQVLSELVDAQNEGQLSVEKISEAASKVRVLTENPFKPHDFMRELEVRMQRRTSKTDKRYPAIFVDPIDAQVRLIARGHLGLVMGAYKMGKSLLLMWIALAYIIQRLNVLYITLEDPLEDLEDRLDAAITNIPISDLRDKRKRLSVRFRRFKRLAGQRLRLIDATETGITVAQIEELWSSLRDEGFTADCVIVDYDDEVVPSIRNKDRRFEFAQIYRDLRKMCARLDVLGWTAAQTKRGTKDLKVLSGDDVAEDISKMRKVACCISIGRGEWGDQSIYLNIAAHKYDRQNVGSNVMCNREAMQIYDRTRTLKRLKAERLKPKSKRK